MSQATPDLAARVRAVVDAVEIVDIHTHLFPPAFGGAHHLSGIDELLTYHYLLAEFFRCSHLTPEAFFALPKAAQADRVWQTLFVERTPLSEAASGVTCVLAALGLDPGAADLREARAFFQAQDAEAHLDHVLRLAGVSAIVMTNDPFDPVEAAFWLSGARPDPRFRAALRLDVLLGDWGRASRLLRALGHPVGTALDAGTLAEVRRFLDAQARRMEPVYLAASLPDDFAFPEESARGALLAGAVLPFCEERDIPLALMIGVRRQVNPRLGLAGDGVGRADLRALERLALAHPDVRVLATVLSRENQHETCVLARKAPNVMPFGCWWFVSNASIVEEITRERLEMLGTSFIAQHSDARVLEQLVYKWRHARRAVANALVHSYAALAADSGRPVAQAAIEREVARLFAGNFTEWVGA
jgi:hypothetical protein